MGQIGRVCTNILPSQCTEYHSTARIGTILVVWQYWYWVREGIEKGPGKVFCDTEGPPGLPVVSDCSERHVYNPPWEGRAVTPINFAVYHYFSPYPYAHLDGGL